jgi:hypothetical protein
MAQYFPGTAKVIFDLPAFACGAGIAPEYGGAENVSIRIQANQPVHLTAESEAGDGVSRNCCVSQQLTDGLRGCSYPMFRVLFCPAGRRHGQWILKKGRSSHCSCIIEEQSFRAACSNIDS